MKTVVWAPSFRRAYKRCVRKRPDLHKKIIETLQLLMTDVTHPLLKTHKLHGELGGLLACSVEYDPRIVFEIVDNAETNEKEILFTACRKRDRTEVGSSRQK